MRVFEHSYKVLSQAASDTFTCVLSNPLAAQAFHPRTSRNATLPHQPATMQTMLTRSATKAFAQTAVAKQARKSVALRASGVEGAEAIDPKVRCLLCAACPTHYVGCAFTWSAQLLPKG